MKARTPQQKGKSTKAQQAKKDQSKKTTASSKAGKKGFDLEAATKEVERLRDEIITHQEKSLPLYIELGQWLTAVKDNLKHGEWLPWLARVHIGKRSAQYHMAVFREPSRLENANWRLKDVRTTDRKSATVAHNTGAGGTGKGGGGPNPPNPGKPNTPWTERMASKVNEIVMLAKEQKPTALSKAEKDALRGNLKTLQELVKEMLHELNAA